ncbi:MAG TPA: hypothetical protein VFD32_15870, partial [Dehalococcoidia bacterium]|nr:hypothetical protein [Dehalococcoidia bacterium]
EPLSVAELHDFGLKLQELWGRLTPKEQTFFGRLLAPAEDPQDGEVQGYAYLEYGQTALGMIWTLIQNNPNPFTPQPVTATPVSAASSGTTAGSYGGPTSARQLN